MVLDSMSLDICKCHHLAVVERGGLGAVILSMVATAPATLSTAQSVLMLPTIETASYRCSNSGRRSWPDR